MKTNWEKLKNSDKAKYLNSFKNPYKQEIDEADDINDKKYLHDCYTNKLKQQEVLRYTEETATIVRLNVWEIMNNITLLQKKKKYKYDYNAAFELFTGSLIDQEKKEAIKILAKYEAYTEFDTFIKEQDEVYRPTIATGNSPDKLKWLGKPEQFAYVFLELAKKGYIEIPTTHGDISYSKYASVCYELFDFVKSKSSKNLIRAMNPQKNQLSLSNQKKFVIPEMKDIS